MPYTLTGTPVYPMRGFSPKITVDSGWTANAYIITGGTASQIGSVGTLTSAHKASDYIPTNGAGMLVLRMPRTSEQSPVGIGMCFYDKNKAAIPTAWTHYFFNRGSGDNYSDVAYIYIPGQARYFRTTYWNDAYVEQNCPTETFYYKIGSIPDEYAPITHELPCNSAMMNVIRRSRQLTDVIWTPLVDVPRFLLLNGSAIHALDWFKAGHTYVGIPYSGAGEGDSWSAEPNPNTDSGKWGYYKFYVGEGAPGDGYVSIETFITASRFPNSIFSERTGQTEPSYDSSIYGIVCNGLTNYALGMKMPVLKIADYPTDARFYLAANSITAETAQETMLCDVLWISGHVMIVTDIMRDASGAITAVEISEATTIGNGTNNIEAGTSLLGGVCRRKFYTISEYVRRCADSGYKSYRWKAFCDIPYIKSNFVDTGNEGDFEKIIDLPCIPYLGNKAVYHAGSIVNSKIVIGATGFTSLVVTKDGAAFGTFDVTGLTEKEVGFTAAGEYEAHLVNANNKQTTSCYWTVV